MGPEDQFIPHVRQAGYKYKHKKDMLGREGLVLHAISEWIHRDGLKHYHGYNKQENTYNNESLLEYDVWLHALHFMSLTNLYAHYAIDLNGDLIVLKPNTARVPHAGLSKWKDKTYLNNWYVGVEVIVEGRNYYGQFIDKINNTDWCKDKQYKSINYLINQLKNEELGCNNVIGHVDCANDDVRGKGKGKQDPGLGFKYDLIDNYSGNY